MPRTLSAVLTSVDDLFATMNDRGFVVFEAASVAASIGHPVTALQTLTPSWNELPVDAWLKDGGRYRSRRHACFVVDDMDMTRVPHRAHWQPIAYNALHGGLERWFDPIVDDVANAAVWRALIVTLAQWCSTLKGAQPWYVEAHQFRIDTADGIGRPTPEGAHRDGVDFVAVLLVDRQHIKGGETRVFEADGPRGVRFTLHEPWSLLFLDDERVIHESTPIQPDLHDEAGNDGNRPSASTSEHLGARAGTPPRPQVVHGGNDGHRDTLVLTFRRGAFQGP
ncbi:MAG TPA: 2OG-Fe dioxygenase family protein [Myxococcota bacterium]